MKVNELSATKIFLSIISKVIRLIPKPTIWDDELIEIHTDRLHARSMGCDGVWYLQKNNKGKYRLVCMSLQIRNATEKEYDIVRNREYE
mgnify:CR=1 FL=1